MEKNNKKMFIWNKGFVYVLTVITVLMACINYASRIAYVFIDNETFDGFSTLLLWIFLINVINLLIISYRLLSYKEINIVPYSIFYRIGLGVAVFSIIVNVAICFVSPENISVFAMSFVKQLPYLFIFFGSLFTIIILPRFDSMPKKIISASLIVAIFLTLSISIFNLYSFKMKTDPVVFDLGDEYIVMWATNDLATGYVEYNYNGVDYKVYDNNGGKINTNTIHKVNVPYEHLRANSYSVHSTRVLDERGYGGSMGKTLSSEVYSFRGQIVDDPNFITVSDWHCSTKELLQSVSYLDVPDMVLMVGDYADALYSENDIIKHVIGAGAEMTRSECPAIIVRGNHDTRGAYSSTLMQYLGLDEFYYDVEYGDINFIVLDSAEDKADDHPEYGGLADFSNYRATQAEWLEIQPEKQSDYTILLIHDPNLFIEEELNDRIKTEFIRLGVDFMICGHHHNVGVIEHTDKPLEIQAGGHNSSINPDKKSVILASQLTLTSNGFIYKAVDNYGNIYFENLLIELN